MPQVIANGCDLLLFPVDPEVDLDYLVRAVAARRLPAERVDEAVLRVLALKAALGLPRENRAPRPLSRAARDRHRRWAEQAARAAVTLVRDDANLLPLDPRRHHRLLLIEPQRRAGWAGTLPPLQIEAGLRAAGFAVERYAEPADITRERYDAAIWVTADEAGAGKHSLRVPWSELLGPFPLSMARTWPELPTVFISLGHPWQVRELAGCPVVINAYSPVPAIQRAVVHALLGRTPFRGVSPVRLPT